MSRNLLRAFVLLGGFVASATAGTIVGTFSMTGTVTVSPTTMIWNSDLAPTYTAQMFTLSTGTGLYVNSSGQNTIDDLNISVEPVGSLFTSTPFIIFDLPGGGPFPSTLDIDYIVPGNGTSACNAAPAEPQSCTPSNAGGSPFTFTNFSNDTASTATWVFDGVTADGQDTWQAIFTAQFGEDFQTVLAGFGPGSPITSSYSVQVTVQTAPEPASFVLMGLGLCAVGTLRRLNRRGRS
jgi:hypothetical protein